MNECTRKNSLRLQGYDYSKAGIYFITICAKNGEMMFGQIINEKMALNEYGKVAEEELRKTSAIWNIALDPYIVMPNHIHFIAKLDCHHAVGAARQPPATIKELPPAITEPSAAIEGRALYVPRASARAAATPPLRPDRSKQIIPAMICRYKGAVTKILGFSLWQRSFYDNIIHDDAEHKIIKRYIENNPATWERDRFYCAQRL